MGRAEILVNTKTATTAMITITRDFHLRGKRQKMWDIIGVWCSEYEAGGLFLN